MNRVIGAVTVFAAIVCSRTLALCAVRDNEVHELPAEPPPALDAGAQREGIVDGSEPIEPKADSSSAIDVGIVNERSKIPSASSDADGADEQSVGVPSEVPAVSSHDTENDAVAHSEDTISAEPTSERPATDLTGYLSNRFAFSRVVNSGLVSTRDMPFLLESLEANIQLRTYLGSKQHFVYADVSLFAQAGWLYYRNDTNSKIWNADHDITSLHPYVVPSELYASSTPLPWLNLLAGKKRIVWGSGFVLNPTNLLSPPKDPTDPNYQRAGNWLARVEMPFERVTVTGVFAPEALYSSSGIPYAMLYYPAYRPEGYAQVQSSGAHYLAMARAYALVADADINLMYFHSNHYSDAFRNKSRWGMSVSRYFFTDYELHVEALLARGSARSYACTPSAEGCSEDTFFATTKLESRHFFPRIVVGTRRQFADESLVSLEYYYQGDGYTRAEFGRAVRGMQQARLESTEGDGSQALPDRFRFDALRRHYLFVSYSKPHIADDWTVGAVLIAGLADLSGLVSPSVAFSAEEWLLLSLYGYVPIHGLRVGEVEANGRRVSEYSLVPYDYRVLFEARAFY